MELRSRRLLRDVVIPLLAACLIPLSGHANVQTMMPDFYAEPGLSPFRGRVSANVDESIDTFTGALTLTHTDLLVPGNGGLDIKIQRSYNSNSVYDPTPLDTVSLPYPTMLADRSPYGVGWTMHFGRLLGFGNGLLCNDNGTNNLDNGILELPDGSQHILFRNATASSSYYITKDQWVGSCGSGGMVIISPEGVKYYMNQVLSWISPSGTTEYVWYTTRIEDRNGNWIAISYDTSAASGVQPVFNQITSSDGRNVSFSYSDSTGRTRILLRSISASGQTWVYNYTPITGDVGGRYHLTHVNGPASFDWRYDYYSGGAATNAGNHALYRITHPYRGSVEYTYRFECLNVPVGYTCSSYRSFYSLVVATKRNRSTGGTWSYQYNPSSTEDVTTVNFPGGRYVFRHYGSRNALGGSTTSGQNVWKAGLLKEKETYNGGSLMKRETYTWQPLNRISNERYIRPPHLQYSDSATFAPVLTRKEVVLDGTSYVTTYSNFDASFNPQTISESGQANRTTNLSYFPRVSGQNIVRLVKDEVIQGQASGKSIYRTFDSNGNMTQIIRHGVTENYSYHGTGDVASRTNARRRTWTFANFYRGVPRTEQHPEGVRISRTVNGSGTIASETDGRGNTTSYTYDGMNRVTSIRRPAGTTISVSWSSTGRTVNRGAYTQSVGFDPFGRIASVNTNGVTKNYTYNDLGHLSFESYFSSSSGDSINTDVLGRILSIRHGDGSSRSYSFSSGNRVSVTNERGYSTAYTYRSFGDPENQEERVLVRINAPEGVITAIGRDILGLTTSVSQGGVTRTYGYNSDNFLTSETNPETGTTSYGRDQVGNMTSRSVSGSGTTTYSYDGLNRLTGINYPGIPSVTMQYDGNSNLTVVDNGAALRTFSYDRNDNRSSETLTVGGLRFNAAYGYNGLDHLTSITYPSLRQISYSPDALGRPRSVSPYVRSVSHHPNGVPSALNYANGQGASVSLNARQWIDGIRSRGTVYAADLSYGYDGVGNVTSIVNGLDNIDSKSLSYDGLDRLVVAGAASISYDAAGNISSMRTSAGSLNYNYSSNRLSSVSGYRSYNLNYDNYGNVAGNGRQSFTYDAASNLRSVSGGATASYDYDGKNLRVRAQRNGRTDYFFYGINGLLLGEYDSAGTWTKEYAYLGSKLVATLENVPDVAPTAPGSISVPATSSTGGVFVSWSGAAGAVTRYELQEATDSAFTNPTLAYSGLNLSASFGNKSNGTYYYRVRACSGSACSNYQTATNGIVVNVAAVAPGVPSSISVPTSSTTGTYAVSWGAATGTVTNYELQEGTEPSFTCYMPPCPPGRFCIQMCRTPPTIYSGSGLSFTVGGSKPKLNKTYYYRVRACNGASCSDYRAGSNGVVVTR